jgi:hypothetical protein
VRFSSSTGAVSRDFRWRIARGKHLFPFRTEQLSLSAPMVLGGQPPGRVGRRRFLPRKAAFGRLFGVLGYGRRTKGRSLARRRGLVRFGEAGRRRVSQLGDVLPTGSRPYSPSVAKSISRSTASVSRPVILVFRSNISSYKVEGGSDGTGVLQSPLQRAALFRLLERFQACRGATAVSSAANPRSANEGRFPGSLCCGCAPRSVTSRTEETTCFWTERRSRARAPPSLPASRRWGNGRRPRPGASRRRGRCPCTGRAPAAGR